MNDKTDFTQGSILKKLALFMLPILGALVLQAAYGAVDLLVVGRFGSTAGLSGVSTGSQVLNLVTFVVIQLAMGITVLIARYLGEKKQKQIGAVLGGGAIVFTILALVLLVILVCFARPISILMQAPPEALTATTGYVRICGFGILFIVAYNLLAAIFRGLGDSRSPLLFVLVACIVNIIGDLVFVAGLHGCIGCCPRHCSGAGCQRCICALHSGKKRAALHDHKGRFPIKHTMPQVFKHRASAGTAGMSDPDFLSGTLCLRQPSGADRFLRLRCCLQDRQLCHADP